MILKFECKICHEAQNVIKISRESVTVEYKYIQICNVKEQRQIK